MKLQLNRPIIFFDLETTGLNITHDRIVELSVVKLFPDGSIQSRTQRVNPEVAIPEEASAVHGIKNEDVAQMPTFSQIAKEIADMFMGCDIGGFNSNRFDIPMLDQEFRNAGIDYPFSRYRFIDVQTIFHKKEPRNLSAAYRFYCGKELEEAHSAQADTMATLDILLAQLEKYDDLPHDVDALSDYSSQNRNVDLMGRLIYNDKQQEVINFGKYKGQLAEDVLRKDSGYYSWVMQGDFSQNTKNAFMRIRNRIREKSAGARFGESHSANPSGTPNLPHTPNNTPNHPNTPNRPNTPNHPNQ